MESTEAALKIRQNFREANRTLPARLFPRLGVPLSLAHACSDGCLPVSPICLGSTGFARVDLGREGACPNSVSRTVPWLGCKMHGLAPFSRLPASLTRVSELGLQKYEQRPAGPEPVERSR